MPRTTNHFVLNLTTLNWQVPLSSPIFGPPPPPPIPVVFWPVFVKIDGNTTQVSAQATLTGSASVTGTTGVGSVGAVLQPNSSISIPPAIGQWTSQIKPIPVAPSIQPLLGSPNLPGIFGAVVVVMNPSGIEGDALTAGHTALNNAVESALNNLIMSFGPDHTQITPADIKSLVNQVQNQVAHAVHNAMGLGDKIHAWWSGGGLVGDATVHNTQDDLPDLLQDLAQTEFTETIANSATHGLISLDGSFSRAPAQNRSISLDRAIMAASLTGGMVSLLTTPS
jgi:hypothetical protein